MKKKKLLFLIIIAAILLTCTAVSLAVIYSGPRGAAIARVTQDGVVIDEIDLAAVTEPYSFTVTCESGENHVEVRHNELRIADATCPDGVCVKNGWGGGGSLPIVCLPHKLVITFVHPSAPVLDGVSGG